MCTHISPEHLLLPINNSSHLLYVNLLHNHKSNSSRSAKQIRWQYFAKMAMQLLVHNLMPHQPEMLAMMHIFLGSAGQARASPSNGGSKGQISPILAGPCLVKDNMALGTIPTPGTTPHYHTSPIDHSCLAYSRVGSRHALCETNVLRWNLIIKRVLTRGVSTCNVLLRRACVLARWLLAARCMLRHRSAVYILIFISKFEFSTRA